MNLSEDLKRLSKEAFRLEDANMRHDANNILLCEIADHQAEQIEKLKEHIKKQAGLLEEQMIIPDAYEKLLDLLVPDIAWKEQHGSKDPRIIQICELFRVIRPKQPIE